MVYARDVEEFFQFPGDVDFSIVAADDNVYVIGGVVVLMYPVPSFSDGRDYSIGCRCGKQKTRRR
jgi:hypothetical protein